ncbi:MAG TPA: hypothetical protein VIH03_08340 [Nitrososphaerales archaeon]
MKVTFTRLQGRTRCKTFAPQPEEGKEYEIDRQGRRNAKLIDNKIYDRSPTSLFDSATDLRKLVHL